MVEIARKELLEQFIRLYVNESRRDRFTRLLEFRHGIPTIAKSLCHPEPWLNMNAMTKCDRDLVFGRSGHDFFDPISAALTSERVAPSCLFLNNQGVDETLSLKGALDLASGRCALIVCDKPQIAMVFGEYAIFVSNQLKKRLVASSTPNESRQR